MEENNKLIDLEGLSAFKNKMDSEIDTKIAQAGIGVTYTISKNDDNEIVLSSSAGDSTKVSDDNTTYTFSEESGVLTITGSDGTSEEFQLGGEITKQAVIDALGFTPADLDDIPTKTSDLTNDSGFTRIVASATQPTDLNTGDVWIKNYK